MSSYPGASFAISDALLSLACLSILLLITFLTVVLRTVPRCCLRTLPNLYKRCCRRVGELSSSEQAWKPNCTVMDYKLDEYNSLEDDPNLANFTSNLVDTSPDMTIQFGDVSFPDRSSNKTDNSGSKSSLDYSEINLYKKLIKPINY